MVCASPHFQYVTVAGGLFRTVSHSRLCSSYSAQWLIATALQVKSSQVVVRTALPKSPCFIPAECNPLRGRGRIQLFSLCAVLVSLQCRSRIAGHTKCVSLCEITLSCQTALAELVFCVHFSCQSIRLFSFVDECVFCGN